MIDQILRLLFFVCIFLAAYPFVVYPAILWFRTRGLRSHSEFDPGEFANLPLPTFSVIIPCHNEEKVIERKISNILECCERTRTNYSVIVVSDASTDRTCELARRFGTRIRFIELKEHSGIVGAFKAGIQVADGEVVIFSDADMVLVPDALSLMLSHYVNPDVGGVCGFTSMKIQVESGLEAERLHISLRAFIREKQSILHSTIGPDGSNWSLRRHLIAFPQQAVIADDLVIPLEVLRRGFRYVFEKRALAVETSAPSIEQEFRRRIRTIAGGMQAALCCRWMFSRPHRWIGFHLVSSKLAKHATMLWAGIAVVCASILAAHSTFYWGVVGVACVSAVAILAAGITRSVLTNRTPASINFVWHLFLALFAPFLAVRYLIKEGKKGTWVMTPRADPSDPIPATGISGPA